MSKIAKFPTRPSTDRIKTQLDSLIPELENNWSNLTRLMSEVSALELKHKADEKLYMNLIGSLTNPEELPDHYFGCVPDFLVGLDEEGEPIFNKTLLSQESIDQLEVVFEPELDLDND